MWNRLLRLGVGVLIAVAMVAQTPVLRRGVSVRMPVTTHAVAAPDADLADSLVVAVTHDGSAFLNVGRETPSGLAEALRERLAASPDRRVFLKGDARTPFAAVARVLDALRSAGVDAPVLLTSQPGPATASYQPPAGLEALLAQGPEGARVVKLEDGLDAGVERGEPVALVADGATSFGDVVRAVDFYRGVGARVYLGALTK